VRLTERLEVGLVISRKATFEPNGSAPAPVFTTVIFAVPEVVIFAARTVTVQAASAGGFAGVQVVGSGNAAPFQ
jgi:hypothetical protein